MTVFAFQPQVVDLRIPAEVTVIKDLSELKGSLVKSEHGVG
jgi:hypothetical protein